MAEPTRAEVDQMIGRLVLEFGASWCPYCKAIQPIMAELLAKHPTIRHIQVDDGKGRPLGRSFRVTLWPTLAFMRDGRVVHRVERPTRTEIEQGFEALEREIQ